MNVRTWFPFPKPSTLTLAIYGDEQPTLDECDDMIQLLKVLRKCVKKGIARREVAQHDGADCGDTACKVPTCPQYRDPAVSAQPSGGREP